MAGPAIACANLPISTIKESPGIMPSATKIVPISSDANNPCAIAPIASIKYRFAYFFRVSFMQKTFFPVIA